MPRYTFTAGVIDALVPYSLDTLVAQVTAPDRAAAVQELNRCRPDFINLQDEGGTVQRIKFACHRDWREEDITMVDHDPPPWATTEEAEPTSTITSGPLFDRKRLEAAYDAHYQKARNEGADHDTACEAAGNYLYGILARHLRIFRDKHAAVQQQAWQQLLAQAEGVRVLLATLRQQTPTDLLLQNVEEAYLAALDRLRFAAERQPNASLEEA